MAAAKHSPFYWVAEPLLEHPTLVEKRMFGCDAFYLFGRLQLVLCAGEEEPWNGILIPTEREYHQQLEALFPQLAPHAILGKWLYLSETEEEFEEIAQSLVDRILKDDKLFGVLPEERRKRKAGNKKPKSKSKK